MSDYKQTRDAAGNVTTQYDKMLRNLDDDLVKRLRDPRNIFYEYAADDGAFLREAADRIEELEAKLAQQDDLVQAAVAAAYEKAGVAAVDYVNAFLNAEEWTTCGVYNHITALITPDARAALDRAVAAERERCAKVAQQQAQAAQKEVTRLMKEHGSKTAEDIWTGRLIAAQEINAAIRKGGE